MSAQKNIQAYIYIYSYVDRCWLIKKKLKKRQVAVVDIVVYIVNIDQGVANRC